MNIFAPFHSDLDAAIEAVWPEMTSIQRVTQLDRVNWKTAVNDGSLVPPFVVVQTGVVRDTDEGVSDCVCKVIPVTVYYVADQQGADEAGALEQSLTSFQSYIYGLDFAYNVPAGEDDEVSMDTSETNPVNVLLLQAGAPLLCGSLTFTALVGYDIGT